MMNRQAMVSLFLQLTLLCSPALAATVPAFTIPSVSDQKPIQLVADRSETTVVCFLGTECPVAQLYGGRLAELAERFAEQDVRFIGVSSNRQDSSDEFAAYAAKFKIRFEMGKDHRNVVADGFGVTRVPEVFVLDRALTVRYRGRIDDQYDPGITRAEPERHYLRDAIEQLLADEPVKLPVTEATGCLLGRVREPVGSSDVTYCEQVSRIFQNHCVECHRAGEIGPFEITDYEEVLGWADMIVEVVDTGRMPPWHAHPDVGQFANERRMSKSDKQTLRQWVENGMPYGDPAALPEPLRFTEGWRMSGAPDLVLQMSQHPFHVPAEGTVDYQYFVVDPGFEEDKWVSEVQVRPGNAAVLHHSIVFVRPPDGERFRGVGWIGGYVPGQREASLPAGAAFCIPAKSKLVFQQHYTPVGTPQEDTTKLAIRFADPEAITHEVYSVVGIDQEFEIPPHADSHQVTADIPYFPKNGMLLSIMPHMHLRGRSFELWTHADGELRKLLEVPEYDFNWQHSYHLTEPLPLDAIDRIEFKATFDNSSGNPVNPDPSQFVTWGDQTWEEMAVVFLVLTEPLTANEQSTTPLADADTPATIEVSPELQRRISAEADRILDRFDKNKDGEVTRYEAPFAFRIGFRGIDQDRNERLTREELEEAAYYRLKED